MSENRVWLLLREGALYEQLHGTDAPVWPEVDAIFDSLMTALPAVGIDPWRVIGEATNGRIEELGAMPYGEYLRTPEWQLVRRFARERARGRCQLCNGAGHLQVHHRTYERLGVEDLNDVTVLCGDCHATFHEHRTLVTIGGDIEG